MNVQVNESNLELRRSSDEYSRPKCNIAYTSKTLGTQQLVFYVPTVGSTKPYPYMGREPV